MRSCRIHVSLLRSVLLGLVLFSGVAWSETLYVDGANPSCDNTAGTPYCSLQSAINAASSGDTIIVSNGIYAGEIVVNKPLTIQGSGDTKLAGSADQRAVFVQAGHAVTLRNVIILNGDKDIGGGILNEGSLTIVDSTIVSNTANGNLTDTTGRGGAVYNAATVTLVRCVVERNRAVGDYSYGYAARGGAVFCTANATLIISNSTIRNNTADRTSNSGIRDGVDGYGGGIYADGYTLLADSTVSGNTSCGSYGYRYGGGTFGGGIHNQGTLIIRNCTIASNLADLSLTRAYYSGGGGGIYNTATVIVEQSSVEYNRVYTDFNSAGFRVHGGGIGCAGAGSMLVISNSVILGNLAEGSSDSRPQIGGGGIYSEGRIFLVNSTIGSNKAYAVVDASGAAYGGGIYTLGALDVRNCTIAQNYAHAGGTPSGYSAAQGGGIHAQNQSVTLRNTILADNLATSVQPDLWGSVNSLGNNLVESFCTITNVTASVITGTDPMLAPCRSYGGARPAFLLRMNSPAIDRGGAGGPSADQRGVPRPLDFDGVANTDDGSDIGAIEFDNRDGDTDGMFNDWEFQYGLNPTNDDDSTQDADGDDLNNLGEFQHVTDPGNSDSDSDGMGDGWEALHTLSPTNASDGLEDDDGDGAFNRDEFIADTQPTNGASKFVLSINWTMTQNVYRLSVPSSVARQYLLQYRTNLENGAWSDVAAETAGNGGTLSMNSSNTLSCIYYRAKVRKP